MIMTRCMRPLLCRW